MKPRKRFGQHFLCNPIYVSQIIQAIKPRPEDCLVEIGPGQGALTIPLLKAGHTLYAIEIDRDMVAILQQHAPPQAGLHLFCEDALSFDFSTLAAHKKLRLIGNLPYNISTPLLIHLLDFQPHIHDIHFMFQREVAQALSAAPGDEQYSRMSVLIQCFFDVFTLFDVTPDAFDPPPKVMSSIVRMLPKPNAPFEYLKDLSDITRKAFSQRRKPIRKSLGSDWELDNGGARPDALSPADFMTILHKTRKS